MNLALIIIVAVVALIVGYILGGASVGVILTSPGRVLKRHNRLLVCGCGHHLSFHDDEEGACHNGCFCKHYTGMTPAQLEEMTEDAQ